MADESIHTQTGKHPDRCYHLSYDKAADYIRVHGSDMEAILSFMSSCLDMSDVQQAFDNMNELQKLPKIREDRETELMPKVVGVNMGTMFERAEHLTLQEPPSTLQRITP